uniref:Uncharacterized protein n=1 Tax=Arundo donax TaxID=35708 RepID=A0A0A9GTW4_ARUDO
MRHLPGFPLEGNYSLSLHCQCNRNLKGWRETSGCNYHLKIWRENQTEGCRQEGEQN